MPRPFANPRIALALAAFFAGMMGFVQSTAALPAGSTALAADALLFLQNSAVAAFALWSEMGAFKTRPWMARSLGATMMVLGLGVLALAAARLARGSAPLPSAMALFGFAALVASATIALVLSSSRWPDAFRAARFDFLCHAAILAAALLITFTGSNIPDIAVGVGGAALVISMGLRMLMGGRMPLETE